MILTSDFIQAEIARLSGADGIGRKNQDLYETPPEALMPLLQKLGAEFFRGKSLLEPCAGNGAIIREANRHGITKAEQWTAVELQEKAPIPGPEISQGWYTLDFLTEFPAERCADVILTNPPFSLAMEFIQKARIVAKDVFLLLRLNFLGSLKRNAYWRENMPDVFVLSDRPSFEWGGTDMTEYAWFRWNAAYKPGSEGTIEVLPLWVP